MEGKYSPIAIQAATAKVLKLFAEFKKEYDGLVDYKQHRYTAQTAKEWGLELLEAGINKEQFAKGAYLSIKRQKYPPERAYTFIELCRDGEVSEYLDTQTAFETACRCAGMRGEVERDWRHPTVLETANRIGWGNLAAAGNGFIKYFATVYEQVVSEHQAGADFEIPKTHRIEAPKPARLDNDSPVAQEWEKMKARFGLKKKNKEVVCGKES